MIQLPLFTWNCPQISYVGPNILDYKVWVEFCDVGAQKCLCWQEMTLKQYFTRWGGDYAA